MLLSVLSRKAEIVLRISLVLVGCFSFRTALAREARLSSGARASTELPWFDAGWIANADLDDPHELARIQQRLKVILNQDELDGEASRADKRLHRGFRELQRLVDSLIADGPQERETVQRLVRETVTAMQNLSRPLLPEKVDFFQTPWMFFRRLSRPVGRGRAVAGNLLPASNPDLSRVDPKPSTFWRRPSSIAGQDLFFGFGRSSLLLAPSALCTYASAKESFGRNPGFEVAYQGDIFKLKFAEVSSEPFASRIFSALGYHTDPTDYAPGVKMFYSRPMLRQFNSRKALRTHFTFLGVLPLFTLNLQKQYDPFAYVAKAVLKDGTCWSGQDLKRHLFRNWRTAHPEQDATNFRREVEASIAYLETVPANVQLKIGKSIGPWDFGQLDHAARRELRGAAVLAAWLGWFDTRFDNTRLRIVKHQGHEELQHFFSDLGGVLGQTSGLLYARGELPNAFPWNFTHPGPCSQPSNPARPFPLAGYKPIVPPAAFTAMTFDDARWMGRLIGALTEAQLTQALVASGFDSAQTRLYLEKLVSRRDQMIRDLNLQNEFPMLRPAGANRRLSYDPSVDRAISVRIGVRQVNARPSRDQILHGELKVRPAATSRY